MDRHPPEAVERRNAAIFLRFHPALDDELPLFKRYMAAIDIAEIERTVFLDQLKVSTALLEKYRTQDGVFFCKVTETGIETGCIPPQLQAIGHHIDVQAQIRILQGMKPHPVLQHRQR